MRHASVQNEIHPLEPPLSIHPLPVPHAPFQQWQIDHKNLTRKTKLGNVAILCIVDSFSTWPILVPVPAMSAETTAKVFFKRIRGVSRNALYKSTFTYLLTYML